MQFGAGAHTHYLCDRPIMVVTHSSNLIILFFDVVTQTNIATTDLCVLAKKKRVFLFFATQNSVRQYLLRPLAVIFLIFFVFSAFFI